MNDEFCFFTFHEAVLSFNVLEMQDKAKKSNLEAKPAISIDDELCFFALCQSKLFLNLLEVGKIKVRDGHIHRPRALPFHFVTKQNCSFFSIHPNASTWRWIHLVAFHWLLLFHSSFFSW